MGSGDVWVASPFPAPNSLFFHGRLNRNVANPFLPLQTPFSRRPRAAEATGGWWGQDRGRSPHGVPAKTPSLCIPPSQEQGGRSYHPPAVLNFILILLSEMGFYKNYRRLLWANGCSEDLGLAKNVGFRVPWG